MFRAQGNLEDGIVHFRLAIKRHQETSDERSEGISLGNLGDSLMAIDRPNEAEEALQRSIALCDKFAPPAAGAFRGSLALLLARKGEPEESARLLQAAESPVKKYPEEYGKFLTKKGQVMIIGRQFDAAALSLQQARDIAEQLQAHDKSDQVQAIKALDSLLTQNAP